MITKIPDFVAGDAHNGTENKETHKMFWHESMLQCKSKEIKHKS